MLINHGTTHSPCNIAVTVRQPTFSGEIVGSSCLSGINGIKRLSPWWRHNTACSSHWRMTPLNTKYHTWYCVLTFLVQSIFQDAPPIDFHNNRLPNYGIFVLVEFEMLTNTSTQLGNFSDVSALNCNHLSLGEFRICGKLIEVFLFKTWQINDKHVFLPKCKVALRLPKQTSCFSPVHWGSNSPLTHLSGTWVIGPRFCELQIQQHCLKYLKTCQFLYKPVLFPSSGHVFRMVLWRTKDIDT